MVPNRATHHIWSSLRVVLRIFSTYMMGSFCENSKQLNAVNYFRNKVFLIRKIFLSHFPCVEKVCKITFVKQIPEAATEGFLKKRCSYKFCKNSQENTCARVSFLIKLDASVWKSVYQGCQLEMESETRRSSTNLFAVKIDVVYWLSLLTILTGKNLYFIEFSIKIHWNTRLAASDVYFLKCLHHSRKK